jgi:hypothetical protein
MYRCDGYPVSARLGTKSPDLVAIGCSEGEAAVFRGDTVSSLSGHPTSVSALSFDRSDDLLAVGCSGGSLWLWDIRSESQQATFSGHRSSCTSCEFHPFGSFFATGSTDTNVKIWDTRCDTGKATLTLRGHTSGVSAIRFSPHGRWLVSGDESGEVKFWDLSSGRCLNSVEAHRSLVESIDFHPSDFFLVSGAVGCKLWTCESVDRIESVAMQEDGTRVRFTPNGTGLVVANQTGYKRFALNTEAHEIACLEEVKCDWGEGLVDWNMYDSSRLIALSLDETRSAIVRHEWDTKLVRTTPLRSTTYDVDFDFSIVEIDENSRPNSGEAPVVHSTRSIKAVLEGRLLVARKTAALWIGGNVKTAVEETLSACISDPGNLTSFLNAIERTKIPISIDTCTKILNLILELDLVKIPDISPPLRKGLERLPFGDGSEFPEAAVLLSTALRSVTYFAQRFSGILDDLKRAASMNHGAPDFAKEDRIARGRACAESFEKMGNAVQESLRTSKLYRKEKEQAIAAIAVINSR